MEKKLNREVFETSRILEYFTEKELRAQIGHDKYFWPVAILRELIDNSLDACENINKSPIITIDIQDDFIKVADNGPGIPEKIINKSLDYLIRVSDKAYYISPTRGQMGNALKVVYATPFVHVGNGCMEIASKGKLHYIELTLDRLAGQPKVIHTKTPLVKNETFVKIHYPDSTRLLFQPEELSYKNSPPTPQQLIDGYSAFNPHATFILNGENYNATDTAWEKWRPDMPTSAHWYNTETLSDLVAGYLVKERENGQHKTVREFVSEFRGLASTIKQKKITGDYSRSYLREFEKNGDIDRDLVRDLLEKMQSESIPPKPKILGIIGSEHMKNWIINRGGEENTFKYVKKTNLDSDGLPYVLEIAFGVNKNTEASRIMITGLNWSPVIGDIPDPTLRNAVQQARLDSHDPVFFIVHIARPRFEFMDRGKTKIEL
jgi:DNA topoisomerase VI subunit B